MSVVLGRLPGLSVVVLLCVSFFMLTIVSDSPASALDQSSGTIVVTAVVPPARYILVNRQATITEILSNTPTNVVPMVYVNSLKGSPLVLTPAINQQYEAILATTDTARPGVLYVRQVPNLTSKLDSSLLGLTRFESVLISSLRLDI
jgi:hypothetical protein